MASSKQKPAAGRLSVMIDGAPQSEEEARATWTEFSRHMDENEGDFDGFAKKKGWSSVKPEHRAGRAVLIVKTA